MHKIAAVILHNFRSCREAVFTLSDFTPMVGPNFAGKTTILLGLQWALMPVRLKPVDAFAPEGSVSVELIVDGLSREVWMALPESISSFLKPFSNQGVVHFRRYQADFRKAPVLQIRIPVKARHAQSGEYISPNPELLENALALLLPQPFKLAMNNGDSVKKGTVPVLLRLWSTVVQELERDGFRHKDIKHLESLIAENEGLARMLSQIHVPLPSALDFLATHLIPRIETPLRRNALSHGWFSQHQGVSRMAELRLLHFLAELGRFRPFTDGRQLLLIDEPEIHMHPSAVEEIRGSLKKLSTLGYQVVFSTHTPLMIDRESIAPTLLIRKDKKNGTFTLKTFSSAVRSVIESTPAQVDMLFNLDNASRMLFSDKVLLTEGKTERMLLPDVFECLSGKSMGVCRIGLVQMNGCSDTRRTIEILNAMALPAKAVVDLDFVFKQAPLQGLISRRDSSFKVCLEIFQRIHRHYGITLQDGLPINNHHISAERAYEILGVQADALEAITALHERLAQKDIWVWRKGAIERHLGIEGKNDELRLGFLRSIHTQHRLPSNADVPEVRRFVNWLQQ
jgi:hypothetical protein